MKMNLTEATKLALQGKLTEDEEPKYLSDREDEAKEFFETIKFDELFKAVSEKLGYEIKFEEPKFKGFRYDCFGVNIKSENLAEKCGVMSAIFEYNYVTEFSGGILQDSKTNELYYWTNLHFSWKFKDGGMNGTQILLGKFKDGEWQFR